MIAKALVTSTGLQSSAAELREDLEMSRTVSSVFNVLNHYTSKAFAGQGLGIMPQALITDLRHTDCDLLEKQILHLSHPEDPRPGLVNPKVITALETVATDILSQENCRLEYTEAQKLAEDLAVLLAMSTKIAFCENLATKLLAIENLDEKQQKLATDVINDLTHNIPAAYGLHCNSENNAQLERHDIEAISTSAEKLKEKLITPQPQSLSDLSHPAPES